jgi:O-antigen ligase
MTDRFGAVRAALALAADSPLTGTGPAALVWTGRDGRVLVGRYAHNEYVQVLTELGTVGLTFLLALLAGAGLVVRRGRPGSANQPSGRAAPRDRPRSACTPRRTSSGTCR